MWVVCAEVYTHACMSVCDIWCARARMCMCLVFGVYTRVCGVWCVQVCTREGAPARVCVCVWRLLRPGL